MEQDRGLAMEQVQGKFCLSTHIFLSLSQAKFLIFIRVVQSMSFLI